MEMLTAVQITLAALKLGQEDTAAQQLALEIAEHMDSTPDGVYAARYLAPELLKVLTSLGATPVARTAILSAARGGDNAHGAPVSWLDQQRKSRATRAAKRA